MNEEMIRKFDLHAFLVQMGWFNHPPTVEYGILKGKCPRWDEFPKALLNVSFEIDFFKVPGSNAENS